MAGGTTSVELAETKQRKAPGTDREPSPAGDVDLEAAGREEGKDAPDDAKKAAAFAVRFSVIRLFKRLLRFLAIRLPDVFSLSALWTSWIAGYWYSTTVLLQPPDSYFVVFMSASCHAAFGLSILCWVSTIYVGPGRIPEEKQDCSLPRGTVAMLSVGMLAPERQWGPTVTWCAPCARWKPPFGHHCKLCGTCSLWMDHHCNFCGQCIGFKNMRCFLLMLFYTQMLCFLHVPLALWRITCFPMTWNDWGYFAAFCFAWVMLIKIVRTVFSKLLASISAGWPSAVMRTKYEGLFCYASMLLKKYLQREDADYSDFTESLVTARDKVIHSKGGNSLRGIFQAGDFVSNVELAFGAPVSWRWLLPFIPGGTGNPYSPALCHDDACEAWQNLGMHIAMCHKHAQAEALESSKLIDRFQALEEHAKALAGTGK